MKNLNSSTIQKHLVLSINKVRKKQSSIKFEEKVVNGSTKSKVVKEQSSKLSAELLDQLQKSPSTPYEFVPPTESYLENISQHMRETFEENEGYMKYLEKKYLAPEFLFNEIDKECLLQGIEHPQVIFEHIVNQILAEYYVDYKWYFYIHMFVNKILKTIRPNPNRPNEVINFNDFVTVRSIKWNSHLK